MAFESMVKNEKFASRIATSTAGQLGLQRPKTVVVIDVDESQSTTAKALSEARLRAENDNSATIMIKPAVAFPGFSGAGATSVLPDFFVVLPKRSGQLGAWAVVGDVKDYERVRSNIDDARMLKGYLQVAFGAEALERWSKRSSSVDVHRFGVLAVPRNSSLHPTVVTEDLVDHRNEVAMRLAQRLTDAEHFKVDGDLTEFVEHLNAKFSPGDCTSCSLFYFCRNQLRESTDSDQLLVELGVPFQLRPVLSPLLNGGELSPLAPASWVGRINATLWGHPEKTGRKRIDPVGLPGTVNVVLVKSDAVALGVHGFSIQVVTEEGPGAWHTFVSNSPGSTSARKHLMSELGKALSEAIAVTTRTSESELQDPIHIVVPDKATADLLASVADLLSGSEISRLRYARDVEMGREPLTFEGEPATIPEPLSPSERLAVSFLLEDDRAREFVLRTTTVDLNSTLGQHIIAGGPAVESSRLDYQVGWAECDGSQSVDFRDFMDGIEKEEHTPGAKLAREQSDLIHTALYGKNGKGSDLNRYGVLVKDELYFKQDVFVRAVASLQQVPDSSVRTALRSIEASAQKIWRRRFEFQAFDLIRFGRTTRTWRNGLVAVVQDTEKATKQLKSIVDPTWADENARQAGTKEIAIAHVVNADPLVVEVLSRRLVEGSRVSLLHHNGIPVAERPGVTTKVQAAAIVVEKIPNGELTPFGQAVNGRQRYRWALDTDFEMNEGDELVVADTTWFNDQVKLNHLKIKKPKLDDQMSPRETCEPESFTDFPSEHMWCCRPHVEYEAGISDLLASQRAQGELNPVSWPPVVDVDDFDVAAVGDPVPNETTSVEIPDGLTTDELE